MKRPVLSPDALYRLSQIVKRPGSDDTAIIPVAPSTWWEGIRNGIYPKGIKLSPRVTVWRGRDLIALVEGVTRP
jgi:hypothetical protein